MLARVIRFFTESWGLKLAALGLAILLWLAVTANEPERASLPNVPVEVDLRDPAWRLIGMEPEAVTVTLLGPRGELVDLGNDPPRIVMPIDQVSDSVQSQVVPLQWIQLPSGVRETRVIGLNPDTIRVFYERLASRTLPVRVSTEGDLPEGLALALPIHTNPPTIEVRGPADALARMDTVPLLPVDLSGLRSTTNVPTHVDTAALPGLAFRPAEVNVVLRVVPADSQPGLQADTGRTRPPF